MHELGTIVYVIDTVEDICKQQNLTKVGSITLEVGEVSAIVPEYLVDYFNWARKNTEHLKECELIIENIPAVTFCQDCKKTYPTVQYGKQCPHCESRNTFLITGNQYNIKQIEAQ